ncbi:MAG: helix-turn-helix transcriptional regulator, partial [Acholeplasmataceae bacterium]|nr:helix-turn-helix transcriptional regulator [Acholeplasmataceae bacterium]
MKPLGSAIKFRRKELKMTLEEGAEGICSVSYLSKVENNLIKVSGRFSDLLINRFKLKDLYGENQEIFEKHKNDIILHLINRLKMNENLANEYKNRVDYQALLIKMGYHIINGDVEKATEFYPNLRVYCVRLSNEELAM